jgi:hypothetical protein
MSINPINDLSKLYLEQVVDEAKVDAKLPEHERATARDKRSGINLPGSGTRRTRRAEHEARRGKPKRWWDDDGDGIGWEKGEVRKEAKEAKRWWDDDGDGRGYEKGEVSGKFKRKKKIKESFSNWREDLSEVVGGIKERGVRVQEKPVKNKIKINPTLGEAIENLGGVLLEMEELDEKAYRNLGVGRVERVSSGSYQAPETTGAAAKRKKAVESKPVVAKKVETPAPKEEGRPARRRRKGSPSYDEVKAGIEAKEKNKNKRKKKVSRRSRIDDLLASIRNEGVEIDEAVKGETSERRKALADERRKGIKPLPAKEGEKYAKFKAHQIDYIDKKTKGKYIHGMTREEIELDEKTLTTAETKEKERIVKSMKDKEADFERRYPGRGKEVMYATATKMAKKITEEQLDEIAPLVAGGLALGGAALAGAAIKRAYDAAQSGVNAAKSGTKVKPGQTGIAGAAYNMQKRNQQLQQLMNQSYEPEGDQIDEKTRYAKETGINFRKQKAQPKGGSAKDDKAFQIVSQMMGSSRAGVQPRGKKKVPGQKPPKAGEYGAPSSPSQKVAKRRAESQRSQDMMSSRFD